LYSPVPPHFNYVSYNCRIIDTYIRPLYIMYKVVQVFIIKTARSSPNHTNLEKRQYISIVHPGIWWGLWCSIFSILCSSLYINACSLVPFLLFIVSSIYLLCAPSFSIGHISAIDQKVKIRFFFNISEIDNYK